MLYLFVINSKSCSSLADCMHICCIRSTALIVEWGHVCSRIWNKLTISTRITGADSGGAHPARTPPPHLKLEKIWFFGVKSWFFTRNTSKIFAPPSAIEKIGFFGVKSWFFTRNTPKFFTPPSARRNFFKCAPPNLKSWIRPWIKHFVDKDKLFFKQNMDILIAILN